MAKAALVKRARIAVDPFIKFGQPVITRKALSTSISIGRIDAGESLKAVGDDYDLDMNEVEMGHLI